MPWNMPRSRKLYLALLLAASAAAGWLGYMRGIDGPANQTYEQQCRTICGSLPSQVKRTYIDPMSPESRRNMPRTIECLCGSATSGKRLF
jgi:hypothetical protein